ncbi:MAG TPA: hypothetical protein VH186_19130 [Chloroflexia bacterium]|nr:hypothetical protein [Chloroflexia bacterium]
MTESVAELSQKETPIVAPVAGSLSFTLLAVKLLTLFISLPALLAFSLDLLGLPVRTWLVLPLTLALAAVYAWHFVRLGRYRSIEAEFGEFAFFVVITCAFLIYALWLGRPDQLPVGTSVDAVHQYGLAQYINESGRLPIHATELQANLQDGLAYPPAFVTLAALFSQLSGIELIYALYPLTALLAALSTSLTFALASLILRERPWRLPLAGLAAGLTLLPYGYTFGSFTFQNYLAQILGQTLLLLSLYLLLIWRQHGSDSDLSLLAITLGALLLAYPTWCLVSLAAFGITALWWPQRSWRWRWQRLVALLLPLGLLALLFLKDRLGTGLGTISNEGDVLLPNLARYSWPVVIAALLGLEMAFFVSGVIPRIVALFSVMLALEGLGLWALKLLFDQGSYYALYKLFYPATFLIALLAVIGLDALLYGLTRLKLFYRFAGGNNFLITILGAPLLFGICFSATWLGHPEAERPYPVITRDTYRVAEWMKANLKIGEYSVAYNLPAGTPAYWLQIGIFKQPQGVHAKDLLLGQPANFEDWLYSPDAPPYFVTANLPALKLDARSKVLYQSGNAAVLTRSPDYEQIAANLPHLSIQYNSKLTGTNLELRLEATMSQEPSRWLKAGLALAPAGEAPSEQGWIALIPAEKDRLKKQFLGLNVNLTRGQLLEFYSNNQSLDKPALAALKPGQYTAYIVLEKNGVLLESRKLFNFNFAAPGTIQANFGGGALSGQFLFESALNTEAGTPLAKPVKFDLNEDELSLSEASLAAEDKTGDTAKLKTAWQITQPLTRSYRLRYVWLDEQGQVTSGAEDFPQQGLYPTWLWSITSPINLEQDLRVPGKAGRYQLALTLIDPTNGQESDLKGLGIFKEIK